MANIRKYADRSDTSSSRNHVFAKILITASYVALKKKTKKKTTNIKLFEKIKKNTAMARRNM
jgi:hypothetical protein